MKHALSLIALLSLISCNTLNSESVLSSNSINFEESTSMINRYGKTILERFDAPLGYNRVRVNPDDFGAYLRSLPLKPDGSLVTYYNGQTKPNNNIYASVVDLPISDRNIQMSADAVMRLISEYLYAKEDYDRIVFHADKVPLRFTDYAHQDYSSAKFHQYIDFVMEKVSTPSFCSDLRAIHLHEIKIGDIFVQNTLPNGHAVIVVDMVENRKGDKLVLLAQGFHPAQEIHILTNPNQDDLSPWYALKEGELLTPEWRFMTSDLMRFKFLGN